MSDLIGGEDVGEVVDGLEEDDVGVAVPPAVPEHQQHPDRVAEMDIPVQRARRESRI